MAGPTWRNPQGYRVKSDSVLSTLFPSFPRRRESRPPSSVSRNFVLAVHREFEQTGTHAIAPPRWHPECPAKTDTPHLSRRPCGGRDPDPRHPRAEQPETKRCPHPRAIKLEKYHHADTADRHLYTLFSTVAFDKYIISRFPPAGSRLTLPNGSPTMEGEAVLDGELAVPCTRNPLQRGGIPLERPVPTGRCPRPAALMVWSHAAQPRELRQVREEATVSEQLRVPWECLA